jgi:predicted MFS family arabinose efflux permease
VLTGAFGGVLGSLVLAIVGDAVPESRRGQAIGIVMGAFSVASVLGIPFGLFLASRFSWHVPFFVLGGLSLAVWAVIYAVMPGMTGHLGTRSIAFSERVADVLGLFRRATVRYALLLTALLVLGQFTVISFLSPSLVGNVGFSVGQLGYVYLVGGALTFFTSPLMGRLADRYGKVPVFTLGHRGRDSRAAAHHPARPHAAAAGADPDAATFAVMGGRFVPATALATTVVPPQQRGAFMSLNTSVQQLAAGAAAYLAGLIVVQTSTGRLLHYEWVGYIAAVANVVTLLVIRRIQPAPAAEMPADGPTPDKMVVNGPLKEQVVE